MLVKYRSVPRVCCQYSLEHALVKPSSEFHQVVPGIMLSMETQPETPLVDSVSKSRVRSFDKFIRIFLLGLIVIGIALLGTIDFWVPKLVGMFIQPEAQIVASNSMTQHEDGTTDLLVETHKICDPKEATDGPIGLSECISAQSEKYMDALTGSYEDLLAQYKDQSKEAGAVLFQSQAVWNTYLEKECDAEAGLWGNSIDSGTGFELCRIRLIQERQVDLDILAKNLLP